MYWLIESEDQLNRLQNSGYKKAYVDIVPVDANVHPAENLVSLIYLRPFESTKGFVLPIRHTDAINVNEDKAINIFENFDTLYTRDVKSFYHYFPSTPVISCCLPPYFLRKVRNRNAQDLQKKISKAKAN